MSSSRFLVFSYHVSLGEYDNKTTHYITTTYLGKKLMWDAMYCVRMNSSRGRDEEGGERNPYANIFDELNWYLETQPEETSEQLFKMLEEIQETIFSVEDIRQQTRTLGRIVASYDKYFDFAAAREFVEFSGKVFIPSTFAASYQAKTSINEEGGFPPTQAHRSVTPDKTYTRDDYINLITFAMLARIFFPVFGASLNQNSADTGSDYKEYYAGAVISRSQAFTTSPGYQKLLTYTTAMTANSEKSESLLMDGISREQFPMWVFNLILVRRVAVGNLQGNTVSRHGVQSNLITFIHAHLNQRIVMNKDSLRFKQLKDKKASSSRNNDEESKMTDYEAVRINEESTPGQTQEIRFYMSKTDKIIDVICPQLDRKLYEQAYEAVQAIKHERLHRPQDCILQWVLGPYLPPTTLIDVDKIQVNNFLAIVMAVFWHHDLKHLAAIVSLTQYKRMNRDNAMSQIPRANISSELLAEARELFPHYRRVSGRQNNSKTPPEPTPVTLVKSLVNELLDRDWQLNLPKEWVLEQHGFLGLKPREYRMPPDIRNQLMRLVCRIGRHKYPFHPGVA